MSISLDAGVLYDVTPVDANDGAQPRRYAGMTDPELTAVVLSGDKAAFEELVRRYRNDVFRLAYHFLRNREEAWDASQEIFIKAYRALSRFRGDAAMKTWLMRITANHCKDIFKKRRLKTVAIEDVGDHHAAANSTASPDRALEAKETGAAIEQALEQLSHKHRSAFVLREYEGLSYEQMAEVMGCNMGTVMSRLHHARRKLRVALAQMGVLEGTGYENLQT